MGNSKLEVIMKNTLLDLNNILFEELEKLSDDEMMKDRQDAEINRAKAIAEISSQVIQNANVIIKAKKLQAETLGRDNVELPDMIGD